MPVGITERQFIRKFMETPNRRCRFLEDGAIKYGEEEKINVHYCSSGILHSRRPKHLTEVEWGRCPFYRLETWCTNKYETCSFYPE